VKLICSHTWAIALQLIRQPMYVVPTVVFPSMFFWFFGVTNADTQAKANLLTGSFAAFAVFGVVFLQFGVGLAQERGSPWALFLRTLPLPFQYLFISRILASLFFALIACSAVFAISYQTTPIDLDWNSWGRISLALFAGALPFAVLGVALAYWTTPAGALPTANLIYLPLSFAGGLWLPPNILPKTIQDISPYLPTRHFGEIVWAAAGGSQWEAKYWIYSLCYLLVFLVIAILGYRREQFQRY